MRTRNGFIQGYNAQAVTTEKQIIIAADLSVFGADQGLLKPMIKKARDELEKLSVKQKPGVVLADTGYWSASQITDLAEEGINTLIPPLKPPSKKGTFAAEVATRMRDKLSKKDNVALYKKRKSTIEAVFGQIKHNRRLNRFSRRGLTACRSEWQLIATTHNLLKLWRYAPAPQ